MVVVVLLLLHKFIWASCWCCWCLEIGKYKDGLAPTSMMCHTKFHKNPSTGSEVGDRLIGKHIYIYIYIAACRPVAGQQPWDKQIYKSSCWEMASQTNMFPLETIELQQWRAMFSTWSMPRGYERGKFRV
jgi:hypothetical protein